MDLSFRANLALNHYLDRPTWFSAQPADVNHWFDFIHAYVCDHGNAVDGDELQAYLQRRLGIEEDSPLMLVVHQRVLLMRHILAYLERTAGQDAGTSPNQTPWAEKQSKTPVAP